MYGIHTSVFTLLNNQWSVQVIYSEIAFYRRRMKDVHIIARRGGGEAGKESHVREVVRKRKSWRDLHLYMPPVSLVSLLAVEDYCPLKST